MKNLNFSRSRRRLRSVQACLALAALFILSQSALAMDWNGIEPLKSRRADVEQKLGPPIAGLPGEDGTLHFKVMGGKVTVTFVNAHFVKAKKLSPELEGTVLQIVLQHDNSSETPESMNLTGNSNFEREDTQGGTIFRNLKDGISYTFFQGRLKTTRFSPSSKDLGKARK
ncbi:MAG TPA: hypothetical protein VM095_15130 [Pyrinomonadaceae bacterium]|nr:hypothetical protein [Pyrinomonadaceae bacterium]